MTASDVCATQSVEPTLANHWRLQGVCVTVRKDLCKCLRLGAKVTVVGVPTRRIVTQSQHLFIEATLEVCHCIVESI